MIVETAHPGAAGSDAIVRDYLTEVASRWYGRVATSAEVDRALDEEPYDDLQGHSGVFLVAADGGPVVGCAGVRFVGAVGELTKVFTLPEHRGRGVGSALLRRRRRSRGARRRRSCARRVPAPVPSGTSRARRRRRRDRGARRGRPALGERGRRAAGGTSVRGSRSPAARAVRASPGRSLAVP
ncbi:GNAT family N-acetyltransferase [Curtobacterium flaccumfaciens]|uniref:GNAT family N-acetyltransferase n=1 Tax=Curtobacterium flaccumfaciens TaxID=2035 RepID=UPI003557D4BD